MLHSEAVPPGTLALLKSLCSHQALDGFALVGGTSLALRFGHRMSVDLDFFRPEKFDNKVIAAALADFAQARKIAKAQGFQILTHAGANSQGALRRVAWLLNDAKETERG